MWSCAEKRSAGGLTCEISKLNTNRDVNEYNMVMFTIDGNINAVCGCQDASCFSANR